MGASSDVVSHLSAARKPFKRAFKNIVFRRYGDRAPISVAGRLLAVFVILSGLVIFGLVNSVMATSITTVAMETDYKMYGAKVSSCKSVCYSRNSRKK